MGQKLIPNVRSMKIQSGKIIYAANAVSTVAVLLLVAVVFGNVVARYIFDSNSIAMQEMEWHLFAVVFLFATAQTAREDKHVRVDIFYAHISPRNQALTDLLGALLFVLPVSMILVWGSIDFVSYSYTIGEKSADPGGLPFRFLIKSCIPLAYALVALQSCMTIANKTSYLLQRESST